MTKKPPLSKRFRPPDRNRILIDGTLDRLISISVVVEEKGRNASPYVLRWNYRDGLREHIACANPDCFDGGFSLGDLLRELVRNHQEDFIGTNFCTGRIGDPELAAERPSCDTRYDVTISLRYR